MGVMGSEMGQRPSRDPRSIIGNKEIINNKNHMCWAEQVGVDPPQGESPKFRYG